MMPDRDEMVSKIINVFLFIINNRAFIIEGVTRPAVLNRWFDSNREQGKKDKGLLEHINLTLFTEILTEKPKEEALKLIKSFAEAMVELAGGNTTKLLQVLFKHPEFAQIYFMHLPQLQEIAKRWAGGNHQSIYETTPLIRIVDLPPDFGDINILKFLIKSKDEQKYEKLANLFSAIKINNQQLHDDIKNFLYFGIQAATAEKNEKALYMISENFPGILYSYFGIANDAELEKINNWFKELGENKLPSQISQEIQFYNQLKSQQSQIMPGEAPESDDEDIDQRPGPSAR